MAPPHPAPAEPVTRTEPGSFRDPANRVFYAGDEVYRGLGPRAAEDWLALAGTDFFPRLVAEGRICATEAVDPTELPAGVGADWSTVLRHERVPFVSYPYEWSFAMLRDAALLHLDILREALAAGFTTKDGSAYNVQWRGSEPLFIDIGSFEAARDGEPWAGYRQFCQTMLYPLMLQAHLGLDFQPWLRSRVDGVEAGQMRRMFGGTRRFRAGVLKHVHLHDAMQNRNAANSTDAVRGQLRDAGFSRELVLATVRAVRKLVDRLDWQPPASHWADYQETCTYSDADRAHKQRFVDEVLAEAGGPDLVLDLGANDGTYASIAARHAGYVLALESDPAVVDRLYQRLRADGERRILPLVMDLADPSPGGGWRGVERASLTSRGQADAVLALAVIHHLAIGRNVPLAEVVDWLVSFLAAAGPRGRLVVEFVHPEDPMARRLLANKPAGLFPDYRRDEFERLLAARCTIARREELPSGTRTLYVGIPDD
ncbi:class I SAM-dependent methyltransferase [Solwaraspora sp. WMMD1047]|uniref:class I SAM-dependent methyltransferase n=1 Tax=Solwaraspora sp. WMMD1047 TaxID=3016102 RepID=UPI00241657AA|nr:class I SAM-dependent methyltransferase [Solwaraspora sp. WMMD1047]MDG4831284.1 class I SAM-dependent methyltransferase [Solwaraspora sp. WMMD1047]